MADSFYTTTQVAVFNDSDLNVGISDLLDDAPMLAVMAARSVSKNTYKYSKKTAAPNVGFRSENDGRDNAVATYANITVSLAILDASFAVDIAVAESDERGWASHLGMQATDHLRAAFAKMEDELINGDNSGGFSALADELNALADVMVEDAGGTTADTASSVYFVRSGIPDCHVVWGQNGEIAIGETVVQRLAGSTGTYPAYYTPITAWSGLQIGSTRSVGRIANITADSGKTLTDDLISSGLSNFPAGRGPSFMAMSRRSLTQLQQSRTATNPSGSPAPFPSEAFGVPIIVTDNIADIEALVS